MWREISKGRKHKMQIHTYHQVNDLGPVGNRRTIFTLALQVWSAEHIDSSKFVDQTGHDNPPEMATKNRTVVHQTATVGRQYALRAYALAHAQ